MRIEAPVAAAMVPAMSTFRASRSSTTPARECPSQRTTSGHARGAVVGVVLADDAVLAPQVAVVGHEHEQRVARSRPSRRMVRTSEPTASSTASRVAVCPLPVPRVARRGLTPALPARQRVERASPPAGRDHGRRQHRGHGRHPVEVARGGDVGAVRAVRGEHQEQRLVVGGVPDEPVAPPGEYVGGVVVRAGAVIRAVGEPVAEVGAPGVLEGREDVPARRGVAVRRQPGEVVEVLAEEAGAVAAVGQRGRDGPVLHAAAVELRPAAEPCAAHVAVAEYPGVVGIEAGQDGRPGRAAQRRRHHPVREPHPLVGEQRVHLRHPGQRVGPLVVGHDQYDVGPGVRGRDRAGRQAEVARRERRQHQGPHDDGSGEQPTRATQ